MVSNYKIFKTIAIVLGLIIFFWLIYDYQNSIGKVNQNYIEANSNFLKKNYLKALDLYRKVTELEPNNLYALEGEARCLMRLQNHNEALEIFKLVLKRDKNFIPALTNIAILYDTIEDYEKAIIYYRKAIQQDQRLLNRMSWFKRFIKNIHFKPSTIQERLSYLENQIGLESNERILKNIEIDKLQPDYQM